MTIASAIQNAQNKVANAYTAVQNKGGTMPATQNLSNLPTAIGTITQTNLTTLSVTTNGTYTPSSPYNGYSQVDVSVNAVNNTALSITPTTSAQSFTVSSPYTGYNPISVSAVTSNIDSNIKPQFIRNGVEILSVMGIYGEPLPVLLTCSGNTTWYVQNGELYGCGSGNKGQQGSGDTSNVTTFTKRADNVVQVVCANYSSNGGSTWYINESGELYGCGSGRNGRQGNGSTSDVLTFTKRADNVVQVVCSDNYQPDGSTWYINESGELYGCGFGYQQGSGSGTDVLTFTKRADNVVQVVCSSYTAWYINESGELYGCGYNNNGQQGSGNTTNVTTFTKRADNVKQVACTNQSTWYINSSGELYGCGQGSFGQQGSGSTSNVTTFTKRADNVVQVVCNNNMVWYINESGELYGCGYGWYGCQGNGSTSDVLTFTKRADNVKQVACGNSSTWYINESGELYGCGRGDLGTQGSGDTSNVTTFTKRADNVVQVSCPNSTTWYVNNSNEVYGCGYNSNGQQGSGTSGSGTNVLTFTKRN